MRTPALLACAPAGRRKRLRAQVLRLAVPGGRGRSARSGWVGSDPAVRGPATGSGPCAFAHPRPLPLGSLPDQRSLAGRPVQRRFEAAEDPLADRLAVGLSGTPAIETATARIESGPPRRSPGTWRRPLGEHPPWRAVCFDSPGPDSGPRRRPCSPSAGPRTVPRRRRMPE